MQLLKDEHNAELEILWRRLEAKRAERATLEACMLSCEEMVSKVLKGEGKGKEVDAEREGA